MLTRPLQNNASFHGRSLHRFLDIYLTHLWIDSIFLYIYERLNFISVIKILLLEVWQIFMVRFRSYCSCSLQWLMNYTDVNSNSNRLLDGDLLVSLSTLIAQDWIERRGWPQGELFQRYCNVIVRKLKTSLRFILFRL